MSTNNLVNHKPKNHWERINPIGFKKFKVRATLYPDTFFDKAKGLNLYAF